jgi:hypothetical protein
MRHFLFTAAVAVLPLTSVAQELPGRVFGRVLGPDGKEPIPGVTVRLGELNALSDRRGQFSIANAPAGRRSIQFEMLGYQTRVDTVEVLEAKTIDLVVRLSTKPIELPPVSVTVRARWLEENGFYDRISSGLKPAIITAADIERKHKTQLADVFNEVSGAKVFHSAKGRLVRFMHSAGDPDGPVMGGRRIAGCEPALYIDGRRYQDRLMSPNGVTIDDWNMISVLIVEAIEVYKGSAAPLQYTDNCGVVLIWTKR